MNEREKPILTVAEAAKVCKVSPRTVTKWFDSGRLKGYMVPGTNSRRIKRENLIEFMEDHGLPTDDLVEPQQRFQKSESIRWGCPDCSRDFITAYLKNPQLCPFCLGENIKRGLETN